MENVVVSNKDFQKLSHFVLNNSKSEWIGGFYSLANIYSCVSMSGTSQLWQTVTLKNHYQTNNKVLGLSPSIILFRGCSQYNLVNVSRRVNLTGDEGTLSRLPASQCIYIIKNNCYLAFRLVGTACFMRVHSTHAHFLVIYVQNNGCSNL